MIRKITICLMSVAILGTACEKTTVEGPSGKKLTLVKPANQTIARGASEKVTVMIKRTNFTEAVSIQFKDLPAGVTVVDGTTQIEQNDHTFVLSASPTADLVGNHVASVTATGPEGLSATEQFNITVKEKS
jgi:hypothetical protein